MRILSLLMIGLLLLVLPAAALETIPPVGVGGPTDLRAYVRYVNLTAGAPTLHFLLDGYDVSKGVPYGGGTGYQAVMSNRYTVSFFLPGAGNTPPVTQALRLTSQFYYTLLAVGTIGQLQFIALGDDPGLPPSGTARVRFVNAAPNTPALAFGVPGSVPLFADVAYGQSTPYQSVPAATGCYVAFVPGTQTPLAQIAMPTHPRSYTVVLFNDARNNGAVSSMILVERE